jgi:hypothetical protein
MERKYTKEEVEAMCSRSYLRGMSIQVQAKSKSKKPPKVFTEWVKELIEKCPRK